MCSNLPDDWDEAAFQRYWGTKWYDCEECEYYVHIEDGDKEAELCNAGDLCFIPEERGCEIDVTYR